MRKTVIIIAMFSTLTAIAQTKLNIHQKDGAIIEYKVADIDSIVFTPRLPADTALSSIETGDVKVTNYGGWFESGFVEWSAVEGADNYHVYCKKASASDDAYQRIDPMLIRKYPTGIRADVLGLEADDYNLKIIAVNSGREKGSPSIVSIKAKAYNREGYAHFNNQGVGAYNDNGTLKENAVVLYVTEDTKKSVSMEVFTSSNGTTQCTGISNILKALQKGYETRPICIRLIGQITADGMTESGDTNNLLVKASSSSMSIDNVTIEGVGEDATCYGFGIRAIRAHNLEIRNLAIMLFGDDGIAFENNNKNIWIHNNDIFYGTAGSDADQAKGDGSIDLKDDSQYMTIAYNHFFDSGKMSLCGMKKETGPNYISYHHNWFDHSDSRHPRIRTMSVHIYNNYYDGTSKYGVGVTYGGSAFVEANYFRNVVKPMLSSGQGTDAKGDGTFSGETGGIIKSFNNYFTEKPSSFSYITQKENATDFDVYEVSSRNETIPASYKTVAGGTSYHNFDTDNSLIYNYTPTEPSLVKTVVTTSAGRMNGGDFHWNFNNNVDDQSHTLNEELMNAIRSYKTKLISCFDE